MQQEDRSYLTALFDSAIRAADPKAALAAHLPAKPKGRVVVIEPAKRRLRWLPRLKNSGKAR